MKNSDGQFAWRLRWLCWWECTEAGESNVPGQEASSGCFRPMGSWPTLKPPRRPREHAFLFFLSFSLANTHCRTVQLLGTPNTRVGVTLYGQRLWCSVRSTLASLDSPLCCRRPRHAVTDSSSALNSGLSIESTPCLHPHSFFCLILLPPDRQKRNHAVCAL